MPRISRHPSLFPLCLLGAAALLCLCTGCLSVQIPYAWLTAFPDRYDPLGTSRSSSQTEYYAGMRLPDLLRDGERYRHLVFRKNLSPRSTIHFYLSENSTKAFYRTWGEMDLPPFAEGNTNEVPVHLGNNQLHHMLNDTERGASKFTGFTLEDCVFIEGRGAAFLRLILAKTPEEAQSVLRSNLEPHTTYELCVDHPRYQVLVLAYDRSLDALAKGQPVSSVVWVCEDADPLPWFRAAGRLARDSIQYVAEGVMSIVCAVALTPVELLIYDPLAFTFIVIFNENEPSITKRLADYWNVATHWPDGWH